MIRQVLSAAIALCATSDANAATVRFKQYTNPSSEEFRTFNKLYLDGVKEGLIDFNMSLKWDSRPPFFCLPSKLAQTVEQAEDIMVRKAKTLADPDTIPIALILLEGLKETFPCDGAGK